MAQHCINTHGSLEIGLNMLVEKGVYRTASEAFRDGLRRVIMQHLPNILNDKFTQEAG